MKIEVAVTQTIMSDETTENMISIEIASPDGIHITKTLITPKLGLLLAQNLVAAARVAIHDPEFALEKDKAVGKKLYLVKEA